MQGNKAISVPQLDPTLTTCLLHTNIWNVNSYFIIAQGRGVDKPTKPAWKQFHVIK